MQPSGPPSWQRHTCSTAEMQMCMLVPGRQGPHGRYVAEKRCGAGQSDTTSRHLKTTLTSGAIPQLSQDKAPVEERAKATGRFGDCIRSFSSCAGKKRDQPGVRDHP